MPAHSFFYPYSKSLEPMAARGSDDSPEGIPCEVCGRERSIAPSANPVFIIPFITIFKGIAVQLPSYWLQLGPNENFQTDSHSLQITASPSKLRGLGAGIGQTTHFPYNVSKGRVRGGNAFEWGKKGVEPSCRYSQGQGLGACEQWTSSDRTMLVGRYVHEGGQVPI